MQNIITISIDEYLTPNNIQAIICSHSPEILGAAFDSDQCALFHLQSPTVMSPILPEDRREVFDALRRLGVSAGDMLFSAGSIFVEGGDDVEILEAGFSEIVVRYNVTQLGGRGSVEQKILTLQEAERKGEVDTLKCFIFDLDNAPTSLHSTQLIKVLQWRRRCIENYLIDEKVIYDLLSDGEISVQRIERRGEAVQMLKEIAFAQLRDIVGMAVYTLMNYENPGLRPREIAGKSYLDMAIQLFQRLKTIQDQVSGLAADTWQQYFVAECGKEEALRRAQWETDWLILCDGKRFFRDLHQRFGLKVSPLKLKKMIVERMEKEQSDTWVGIEKLLTDALRV